MVKKSTTSMLLTKLRKQMKEITLRVPDELAPELEALVKKMALVMEVEDFEDELSCDELFEALKKAFWEVWDDKVIRRPRDFGWIWLAMDQGVLPDVDGFNSAGSFRAFLKFLKINPLPCRNTLSSTYNLVEGEFPDWLFMDLPDATEATRRKNVVVRFKSAYMRAKRALLNNKLNKCE